MTPEEEIEEAVRIVIEGRHVTGDWQRFERVVDGYCYRATVRKTPEGALQAHGWFKGLAHQE